MPEGTIKWYDDRKGYGLIAPEKGDKDVVFKKAALRNFAAPPSPGTKVSFEPIDPRRGTEAKTVLPGS